jgi:hypothetical protein
MICPPLCSIDVTSTAEVVARELSAKCGFLGPVVVTLLIEVNKENQEVVQVAGFVPFVNDMYLRCLEVKYAARSLDLTVSGLQYIPPPSMEPKYNYLKKLKHYDIVSTY